MPTVADLRERRIEILRANLREALLGDGFDRFRGVVEPLTEEFDVVDIALAAVSLIEGAGAQDADEVELFSPPLSAGPPPRGAGRCRVGQRRRPGPDRARVIGPDRDGWPAVRRAVDRPVERAVGPPVRRRRPARRDPAGRPRRRHHQRGARPRRVVGAIQINEGFSLVDVQEGVADAVIAALREATIRGKRLQVRRDQ